MPHTLPIVPAWHPAINSAKNFPFSFASQLFCVFVCRRTKEHRCGVDISHSYPETCCFSALVTPTLILMMVYEYLHIFYQCVNQTDPHDPWHPSLSSVISSIFSSLCSHVCVTAPASDSYCPTQATSILIIYSALFDAQYLAAKPMCEAQQTKSVVRRSAALRDVWAFHRVFVFRHISKNVCQTIHQFGPDWKILKTFMVLRGWSLYWTFWYPNFTISANVRFPFCFFGKTFPALHAAERGSKECASNSRNKSCSLLSGLRADVTASVNRGQGITG